MKRKIEQGGREREKELRKEEWRRILEYDSRDYVDDNFGAFEDKIIKSDAMMASHGLERDWSGRDDSYGSWYGD